MIADMRNVLCLLYNTVIVPGVIKSDLWFIFLAGCKV